ncbi:transposase IS116/IS110/IS902 family protein [Rhizobium azibense]|nr:transposase IS116/IS110/IS902 family protein [Rhizobium azibense]
MAYTRGEPHVCAMVHVPSAEEEDQRRISRERKTLIGERVTHVNRIKGLLYSQGVSGYEPLHRDRRKHLNELKTGDGRDLPVHLKRQISRELDRLELLLEHIKSVEADRSKFLLSQVKQTKEPQLEMLLAIKGIGAEVATIPWTEALYRHFDNRRQIASYAGLAPTPWQSGSIDREQGVSKAGNPRLRVMLVQTAWLWLRHQPNSALSGTHTSQSRSPKEIDDRGPGTETARGTLEIRNLRRPDGGCHHLELSLSSESFRNLPEPDQFWQIQADEPRVRMANRRFARMVSSS